MSLEIDDLFKKGLSKKEVIMTKNIQNLDQLENSESDIVTNDIDEVDFNVPVMASQENFAALLEESFAGSEELIGKVIKGTVVSFDKDSAIVDVGLKSEGRVLLRELKTSEENKELAIGDIVDVYLERMEDKNGEIVLSHEKARREAVWIDLEKSFQKNERVNGVIFGKVKGGFTVDLKGAVAFLPGSQVDIRPIRDISPLIGLDQPFQILKMDRARGNIVVSRRSILEESRADQRSELLAEMKEGQVLEGVVKNITDYGAFIDLGGVDGLLHVTDIAWNRVNHPSEVLQIGQKINVAVIRFNPETQRISLGMKQLEKDPWDGVSEKFPTGTVVKGLVTNVTDYGAFVELDKGIEGLVHVSEMSWTRRNLQPNKIVSVGQQVDVMILDLEIEKHRIGLGMKQCIENPWKKLQEKYSVGDIAEGEIKNITEFGLFIGLSEEIDGMVHMSDLSWDESGEESIKKYTKGDHVQVRILDIDAEKERVVLGIKHLSDDKFSLGLENIKRGEMVTCEVQKITDGGLEVKVGDTEISGFIRKAELSKEREDRRCDRFAVGEKLDAKVMAIDKSNRKVNLSVKAREMEEEKKAMEEYGSTDSGASLGDILGPLMKQKEKK